MGSFNFKALYPFHLVVSSLFLHFTDIGESNSDYSQASFSYIGMILVRDFLLRVQWVREEGRKSGKVLSHCYFLIRLKEIISILRTMLFSITCIISFYLYKTTIH